MLRLTFPQTVNNACATVALLNIVNNIPEVDLGEHLSQFKDFTGDFPPVLRGDAISNFKFVKRIHNSFARSAAALPLAVVELNTDLRLLFFTGKWTCSMQTW